MNGASTRWLDLRALLTSYLQLIGGGATLGRIYYFSALATHLQARKPGVVARHQTYIQALQATGVIPVLGRFKRATHYCASCKSRTPRWEEKESDVAIAAKLLEVLAKGEADVVVLVTGDTDLVPAVRTAKNLFPALRLFCAFPYGRKQRELEQTADGGFTISKEMYARFQLPSPMMSPSGRELSRPPSW